MIVSMGCGRYAPRMSVDVSCEVLIRRPRAAVAAVMFDPTRDAEWTTGVVEVRPLTEGRLRTGSRVERISRFLGRKFGYLVEVTDHEDDRRVVMGVTKPFPMTIHYELEDVDGGTLARIRTNGEPKGFFRIAGPAMTPMVRKNITHDLENLKAIVEAG